MAATPEPSEAPASSVVSGDELAVTGADAFSVIQYERNSCLAFIQCHGQNSADTVDTTAQELTQVHTSCNIF